MSPKIFTLTFILIIIELSKATKLPPYFSQCSKSDPKLNECIAHNANGGLYTFVKGDKAYNIEPLLPLFVPQMSVDIDKNLTLNLTNSIISELNGAKVKDVKYDLDNNHMEMAMYMPRASLLGQYSIRGQVSILPINERGPVNITVVHSRLKYSFDYELVERKGFHYIHITDSNMTYKAERSFYILYNLFPEHNFLGDVINSSLNEHWIETNNVLSAAISDALCSITTRSVRGFFDKVPIEELMRE